MKKTMIFIMIISLLIGLISCSRNAGSHTAESLHTETTLESANDLSSAPTGVDESEKVPEESSETDTPAANESTTESPAVGITSRPPAPPAVSTPPPAAKSPSQSSVASLPPASSASSQPASSPAPAAPLYTQEDYDDIIREVRAYAESQTKLKFIWDPTMEKEDQSYFGTPNLTRDGKDRIIQTLKYHVDLTVDVATNPAYGIPSDTVHYNIIWYEKENEYFFEEPGSSIYFVLLYG